MLAPLDDQRLAALLADQVGGLFHPLDVGHVLFGVLQVLVELAVELAHGRAPVERPFFDLVQLLFHSRRVLHVEDVVEALEQKVGHHHAELGGSEPAALLGHIFALQNRREDGGVRGRPSHSIKFQFLDERRLVEARRRLGEVLLRLDRPEFERLALCYQRKLVLLLLVFLVLLILAFHVDREEAVEFGYRPGGPEQVFALVFSGRDDFDGGLVEHRGHHLGRHEAHPDQPVQLHFVFGQMLRHGFRCVEHRSRTNRFVRILRVFLRLVDIGGGRQVGRSEALPGDKRSHIFQCIVGHARRIGAHVGDQSDQSLATQLDAFIQPLREAHRALHAEAQLARGLLLQSRGDERRDRVPLLLPRGHRLDDVGDTVELGDDRVRRLLLADFRRLAIDLGQARRQNGRLLGGQIDVESPVLFLFERADQPLPLDDQP